MQESPVKIEDTPENFMEILVNFEKINKMNNLLGVAPEKIYRTKIWDGDHYNFVTSELRSAGWVNYNSSSECKKAIKETNLTDGNHILNIIIANLMGTFTQVLVRRKP